MKVYSEDLRKKIVDAIRRGMPKAEAARTFGVGISTIKRYATKAQNGEPLKPGKAPGRPPKWMGVYDGRLYLISGGGERSDWVKNLRRDPNVYVRVGNDKKEATARVLKDSGSHPARRVLAAKYQGWREGRSLSGWAAEALLIEVTLRG